MNKSIRLRLIVMNFVQWAVWGAYLTSMGQYLGSVGLGPRISIFYAMQGIVSMFMPALMGIVADRWIPAQKLLSICHLFSALFKAGMGYVALTATGAVADEYPTLLLFYALSVAFFMPTLALSNSVSYTALESVKLDPVKSFPPIRVFGTVGFICSMIATDVLGFQSSANQFFLSAALGANSNHYGIQSDVLDALIMEGRSSTDQAFRKATYKTALEEIMAWGVEVPTYQRQEATLVSTERVNVATIPGDLTPYYGWLAEIHTLELN